MSSMYWKGGNMRITVDAHNDTLMKIIDAESWDFQNDIGKPTQFNIDIDKMEKGAVNLALFAAYTDDMGDVNQSISYVLSMTNALEKTVALNKDRFTKAYTYADIEKGIEAGKRIAVQTIEGAYAVNDDNACELLKQYHDLGVRLITLVWDHSNALGEGTLKQYKSGIKTSGGLTPLGEQVVEMMEEIGILVDVSHMDEETFWSTLKVAKRPLVASHSGAYKIKAHVRNLKDEQIKAIAKTGGVVNVVFCRFFIGDVTSGVETLLDHIEHVIKIGGIEHVGLGSDFDGATMPVDLLDISHMQLVADGLERRGYSNDDIDAVMGGNMLRLLESTMNSTAIEDSSCEIRLEGNGLVITAPDLSNDIRVKVWINGVEVESLWDEKTQSFRGELGVFDKYAYIVATVCYENNMGKSYRKTQTVHNVK